MEFSPANLDDFIQQFAVTLARIHRVENITPALDFLPERMRIYPNAFRRPTTLDDSLDEGRIRATLEEARSLLPLNRPVLLHGDYWLGNLLWKEEQLVGVIDWEDAVRGDPLADLAYSRLEILWAFGTDAMHEFTRQYRSLMPHVDYTHLPYWDLRAALRPVFQIANWAAGWHEFGRSDVTEHTMREGHRQFIMQAFDKLSAL
jgi:aminoglycoside phosphotransferase (APT) family kinase protein